MLDTARPDPAPGKAFGKTAGPQTRCPARARRRVPVITMLTAVLRLAVVSRPGAWVPAALVFLGGITVNSRVGMTWSTWTGLAFVTMPMGLIVFGVNDIADSASDAMNSRKGGAWGAVVNAAENRLIVVAAVMCAVAFIMLDLLTRRDLAALSCLGICLFAYAYSMKPVRLKSRPVADSLSNGFWVVCMFCCGYYSSITGLAGRLPGVHVLIVLLLCGTAVHALTTLLDREVDEAAGDTTIGLFLGARRTLALAAVLFAICFFLVSSPAIKAYFFAGGTLPLIGVLRADSKGLKWLIFAILIALLPSLAAFDIVASVR